MWREQTQIALAALARSRPWTVDNRPGQDQQNHAILGIAGRQTQQMGVHEETDPAGSKPKDLVQRRFTVTASRRLLVVDVNYVRTWQSSTYVAFVTDVFARRIAGSNVASTLRADILPAQALDMAAFAVGSDLTGLTHHSNHGSDYISLGYTDWVIELGATLSTATVGDSYDNALAKAINALYKTELIR